LLAQSAQRVLPERDGSTGLRQRVHSPSDFLAIMRARAREFSFSWQTSQYRLKRFLGLPHQPQLPAAMVSSCFVRFLWGIVF